MLCGRSRKVPIERRCSVGVPMAVVAGSTIGLIAGVAGAFSLWAMATRCQSSGMRGGGADAEHQGRDGDDEEGAVVHVWAPELGQRVQCRSRLLGGVGWAAWARRFCSICARRAAVCGAAKGAPVSGTSALTVSSLRPRARPAVANQGDADRGNAHMPSDGMSATALTVHQSAQASELALVRGTSPPLSWTGSR